MNCIIIEDDNTSLLAIKKCVTQIGYLNLIGAFKSTLDVKSTIIENEVDLIFLDVELPEVNGIEFVKTLKSKPLIILISSKRDYAFEGFQVDAVDYIQKPIDYDRFKLAVDKAQKVKSYILDHTENNYIFIKTDSALVKLPLNEINFIEALGDYVRIFCEKNRYMVLSTMKGFFERLPNNKFMRIHKSYIVNLNKIKEINNNQIPFKEKNIPVSKSHKNELLKKIQSF